MSSRAYWERPLDVFKLIVAIILVVLLIASSGQCGQRQATSTTPVITFPATGMGLRPDELTALEGTAGPGVKLAFFDDDASLGRTTAGSDGRWRFRLLGPLAPGMHSLRVAVIDKDGNELASSRPLAVSVVAPATPTAEPTAVPTVRPTEAPTLAPTPTLVVVPVVTQPTAQATFAPGEVVSFAGTAGPGARILLYLADSLLGETTAGANGQWVISLAVPPSAGDYGLRAVATDVAGNELAASTLILLQVAAPITAPNIVSPALDQTATGEIQIRGTAEPGARLVIYDGDTPLGEAIANHDGEWVFELPEAWSAGKHTLRTVMIDNAGRTLAQSEPLVIEAVGPEPTPTFPIHEK
jgi:hypothetical protein